MPREDPGAAARAAEAAWDAIQAGAWPFQALCDGLCADLVSPQWEARHGAAMALREVLRSHASSAAVQAPISAHPSGASLLIPLTLNPSYLQPLNDAFRRALSLSSPKRPCAPAPHRHPQEAAWRV